MRVVILGMGVQGAKRRQVAGPDCVACVDPHRDSDVKDVRDIPPSGYDAVLCCTPDAPKYDLIKHCLALSKHVLVEKPLWVSSREQLVELAALARRNRVVCYTAYNHRFEPHIARAKTILDEDRLGALYSCRLFYGNGTARQVRDTAWRDQGSGVLADLGSHLLDLSLFLFDDRDRAFRLLAAHRYENASPDHVLVNSEAGRPRIELEMSLLSWRNTFTCDILGERGSLHIGSLCKWGPSTLTLRSRVLPSGRPSEETTTLVREDPTWALEYEHFKRLCRDGDASDDMDRALWIDQTLRSLASGIELRE